MKIKTRHVVIAVILLALLAGIWRALSARRAQQQSASAIATTQTSIEIAQSDVLVIQERNLTQTLGVSGTVKALNYAVIKAKVAGELKEVTVREGDRVSAGQVLARIDPIEYQQLGTNSKSKPRQRNINSKLPNVSGRATKPWSTKVSFLKLR